MLHRTRRHGRWLSIACLVFGATAAAAASDPMPPGYRPVLSTSGMRHIARPPPHVPAPPSAPSSPAAARPSPRSWPRPASNGASWSRPSPPSPPCCRHAPPCPPGMSSPCARPPRTTPSRPALQPQPGRTVTVTRTPTGWIAHEETAGQRRHLVLARGTCGRTCWTTSAPPACPIPWPGVGPGSGA